MNLNSKWQFKDSDSSNWLPANVPGNVIVDLMKLNRINDPYQADNITQVRWIERKNWDYKTVFLCDVSLLRNQHIELLFEGIDTHANVFLNDSLILRANNMFRSWKVEIKELLKLGENELRISFQSAVNFGKNEAKKLPYELPEEERIFSRKAQFQFGWDFSPRLVGCGIWKPVVLNVWNNVYLETTHYQVKSITDTLAKVDFVIQTKCDNAGNYQLKLDFKEDFNQTSFQEILLSRVLKKGINHDTIHLQIKNPSLWWTNGLGKPALYSTSISVLKNSKELDKTTFSVGLRSLELVKDLDEDGITFYFKLNGVPVFIKGANYVPHDALLRSQGDSLYETEIQLLKDKHLNMLRVWGGGVYPDELFYKACDKAGILIWQDLMFACAMYPGDSNFVNNVREEIKEQILKYRNHSSLALWCGNNETDEAWHNWGWQKQFNYSQKDSSKIWNDYQHLFTSIIPQIIQEHDLERPYWTSSPSIGWGRKESLTQGDSHYWGVWWGMQPFEMYQKKIGRFMSEYGFQSLPDFSSIKKFCPDSQLKLNSISIVAHQKHKKGFETIQTYLERDYKTPVGLQHYSYVSQLLQRDGMQMAIEAHRRNKPYCMGTIFWQLNDSWPGASWSAIDYFQQPKALFYSLDNLYKTHLLSIQETDSSYIVFIVSDSLIKTGGKLNIEMLNFKSELLWQKSFPCPINYEKVFKILISKNSIPKLDRGTFYFKLELSSFDITFAKRLHFPEKPINTKFPQANIQIKKVNNLLYEISSNVFAKDVYLYYEKEAIILSDNYFNLEVGEKKLIKVISKHQNIDVNFLKYITLNNL